MPYSIITSKGGAPFKVINKVTRKVHGTHPSLAKAKAQLAALYVNIPESRPESRSNAERQH